MSNQKHRRPLSPQELDKRLADENVANDVVAMVESETFAILSAAALNYYNMVHPNRHPLEHIQKHNTIACLSAREFVDCMISMAQMNKRAGLEVEQSEDDPIPVPFGGFPSVNAPV